MRDFYGYNGGQGCDNMEGPCSCGAWHSRKNPPPNMTSYGKEVFKKKDMEKTWKVYE